MKLFGSLTSPYVRRIRLLLTDTPHEFVNWDIYAADRDKLRRRNPALKIPMLEDDDGQVIYDSRVISRYMAAKRDEPPLSWADENRLTLIDAANDSCVALALLRRSDVDTDADRLFYNLQRERIDTCMQALADMVADGVFEGWQYPAICLYCLVDWVEFHGLFDFARTPTLLTFRDANSARSGVVETNPRIA